MSRTGWLLTAAGLILTFGFLAWATATAFSLSGGAPGFTVHGWIALALALLVTAAMGGGLMWLAFHSSRRGWDDLDREP